MTTFVELLALLQEHEADPEKSKPILAEMAQRIDEVKEHTDALYAESDALNVHADSLAARLVEPLNARAAALNNEANRIYDRMTWYMSQAGFEKLPGKLWRLDLRTNNPKVIPSQEPNAEIKLEFPDLVTRSVSYSWDKKAIAAKYKDAKTPFPYAKLEAKKRVEFEVMK